MSTLSLSVTNPFTSAPAQPAPAPVELPEPRRIRVSYASRFHDGVNLAALTLRGRWLEEAGFPTGHRRRRKGDAWLYCYYGAPAGARRATGDEIPAPRLQVVCPQAAAGAGVYRRRRQ